MMRKRISLIILSIMCLPVSSFAEWAFIPLEELLQDSDFIVVGTLRDVSHWSQDGIDYAQGTISVDEVIWGDVTPGEMLTLKWHNESGLICPRVDHKDKAGRKGIWLLTVGNEREVRADYPLRFVEIEKRKDVETALLERKVCTRSVSSYRSPDETINVSVVFRNPTESDLNFPAIEFSNGYLYLSPEVELRLSSGWGQRTRMIKPMRDRVATVDGMGAIVVRAGQEHRINLNLRDLFEIDSEGGYSFHLRIKGFGSGNVQNFYVDPTKNQNKTNVNKGENDTAETPIAVAGLTFAYVFGALVLSAALIFRQVKYTSSMRPICDFFTHRIGILEKL